MSTRFKKVQIKEEWQIELDKYEEAYDYYVNKNWDAAQEKFQELKNNSENFPWSSKIYDIYLERIEENRHLSLPEDWQGAYRHTSK